MNDVVAIFHIISDNWALIIAAVGAVVTSVIGLASIIVKFTPSPDDDTKLAEIKAWVSRWIALNPKVPPAEE